MVCERLCRNPVVPDFHNFNTLLGLPQV